jgi:septal ring factor EnvC (AmiA/AmiB activator)
MPLRDAFGETVNALLKEKQDEVKKQAHRALLADKEKEKAVKLAAALQTQLAESQALAARLQEELDTIAFKHAQELAAQASAHAQELVAQARSTRGPVWPTSITHTLGRRLVCRPTWVGKERNVSCSQLQQRTLTTLPVYGRRSVIGRSCSGN